MFPAFPVKMLPTLQLYTWRLPDLMGSDQVRLVMFTGRFKYGPFKYGLLDCMACVEVVFRYLTTTDREVLPAKTVTV